MVRYAADKNGLTNGRSAGPLTVPASSTVDGNGVYSYFAALPDQTFEDNNYYVDVIFAPTAPAPRHLIISFDPSTPSIPANAHGGTVVATITASWSDGTPFTGSLGFGPPYSNDGGIFAISGNKLIINPEGPGVSASGETTLNVTITATDQNSASDRLK